MELLSSLKITKTEYDNKTEDWRIQVGTVWLEIDRWGNFRVSDINLLMLDYNFAIMGHENLGKSKSELYSTCLNSIAQAEQEMVEYQETQSQKFKQEFPWLGEDVSLNLPHYRLAETGLIEQINNLQQCQCSHPTRRSFWVGANHITLELGKI